MEAQIHRSEPFGAWISPGKDTGTRQELLAQSVLMKADEA
jgi:hypothetical protein